MTIGLRPKLSGEYYEAFHYAPFTSSPQRTEQCEYPVQIYGGRIFYRFSETSNEPNVSTSLSISRYWSTALNKEHHAYQFKNYVGYSFYSRARLFGGDFPSIESLVDKQEQKYYENVAQQGEYFG